VGAVEKSGESWVSKEVRSDAGSDTMSPAHAACSHGCEAE